MADFSFVGQPAKPCLECGDVWPLAFFEFNPDNRRTGKCTSPLCDHPDHYRARCIGCRLSVRTERNAADPFAVKLRRTLTRHARQDGYASLAVWERATGLSVATMAADAEAEFDHGRCTHCRRRWSSMPNGRADMTLDRHDPDKPLTRSNYRWLCATGNRAKQRTPPHKWDQKQRCWELYDERIEERRVVQPEQLGLDLAV